jgi:uncharacterized protein
MTSFEITSSAFSRSAVREWPAEHSRLSNWPVVYVLDGPSSGANLVYVGETVNASNRMLQHLDSPAKQRLTSARIVVDPTFNKSVCLDLESYLIQMFAGDGSCEVLNLNAGVSNADYYDRARYREAFRDIFDRLRGEGLFSRSYSEIVNGDLFKLSPFKALSPEQAAVVESVVEGYFDDLDRGDRGSTVIEGAPGTGKTVVGIYLLKLISDIGRGLPIDERDVESPFVELFIEDNRRRVDLSRIALVIPQQSLRKSVKKVFANTPGLDPAMVLGPFDVGKSEIEFDLVVVDEAHRLNQRANQSSGVRNRDFVRINERLFGADDLSKTQLDWIVAKSRHQVLLLDGGQSVRPADLPKALLSAVVDRARARSSYHRLVSQMRVRSDFDYIGYVRSTLEADDLTPAPAPATPEQLGQYDLRLFDDLLTMVQEIRARDEEHGLARLVAGYAWEWRSKGDRAAYDIEIDGLSLRWNTQETDWIASPGSLEEVGSIHTVQGYDLNYAGVIIGPDLVWDEQAERVRVDRSSYFDRKGQENNRALGLVYTDEDLLVFVRNIYLVLLTRGIRGTYVYVSDPLLRERLRPFFAGAEAD